MESFSDILIAHLQTRSDNPIRIQDREFTGGGWRTHFEVVSQDRALAARVLLHSLHGARRLLIHDHSRGDSEGAQVLFRDAEGLRHYRGGHGYGARPEAIDEAAALHQIQRTLEATQWGPELGSGWIESPDDEELQR